MPGGCPEISVTPCQFCYRAVIVSRADHRTNTLKQLDRAAIDLFTQIGASVTAEEIAEAAGVSRRTLFRYVEHKVELAYIHPILWLDVFERGLAHAPRSPLTDRLRHGSRQIAIYIDDDPEPPRQAFLAIARHAELSRGSARIFGLWVDRVAKEVLDCVDSDATRTERFHARVIGSSIIGMVDAVTREWVFDPAARFVDLYEDAFDVVQPILDSFDAAGSA